MGGLVDWVQDHIIDPIEDVLESAGDLVEKIGEKIIDLHVDFIEFALEIIGIEDETVYYTAVETQQLIPDEQKSITTKIVFDHALNNTSLISSYGKVNIAGVLANITKFRKYGETYYTYGVPEVISIYSRAYVATVESVLSTIESAPVSVEGYRNRVLLVNDWINWYLQENTAFVYDTQTLTVGGKDYLYYGYTLDSFNNYIIDFRAVVSTVTTTYLNYDRITVGGTETLTLKEHTVVIVDGVEESDTWASGSTVINKPDAGNPDSNWDVELHSTTVDTVENYNLGYSVPAADTTTIKYITVIYHLDATDTVQKIWVYDRTSGIYPALDMPPSGGIDSYQAIPIIPIRQNFISINSDVTAPVYKTTKTALNLLGLNLDQLLNTLENNPEIAKIREAAILSAVNVYSQRIGSIKLLADILLSFYTVQTIDKTVYDNHPSSSNSPVNHIRIQEQNVNYVIQYNYVDRQVVAGTLPGGVDATNEVNVLPNTPYVPRYENEASGIPMIPSHGNEPQSQLIIKRQINAGNYEVFTASGLVLHVSVQAGDGSYHMNTIGLENDIDGNTRRNFVIPLGLGLLASGFTPSEKEAIIYDSMHMVVYANDQIFLNWYETPRFTNLLEGVLAAIQFISLVLSFGGSNSVSAFFTELGKNLLYQYALTLALTKILEEIDSPAARAAAIALYAYISYKIWGGDFVQGSGLLDAESLLKLTQSVTYAMQIDQDVQWDALQAEKDLFFDALEDREEEIEAVLDGLKYDDRMSVFDIHRVLKTNHNEDPTTFYERTIHTGNPGVLALDQISTYVDRQTQLPEYE